MSTRSQLGNILVSALPETWRIIWDGRPIDPPAATVLGMVVIDRVSIEPAPNVQGSYFEELALNVIEPTSNALTSEDSLDDRLEAVLAVLDPLWFLTFVRAERGTYLGVYASYKITIQLVSNKE